MRLETGSEGVMTFEALRGIQAGREFYSIMCSFAIIYNNFKLGDDDPRLDPALKAQRKIRPGRIPKIASYILENRTGYVFSSITVSISKKIIFTPEVSRGSDSRLGTITIPMDAVILVNDGQHRCAAIREAYKKDPTLGSERVSVVVFEDRGLKRSQQMFADLNKHAVRPTRSLGLLYDHRDMFAQFIVNMVDDLDIFRDRTEKERTNISNRSKMFFTLNGIADATKHLLGQKTKKSISAENQKLAVEYWSKVALNIPDWNLLMEKKVSAAELRERYVHAHTNMLNVLGLVGSVLTKDPDWKRKIKGLQDIEWEKTNPLWQDKIVMDGKMLKNRLGIKRAANAILAILKAPSLDKGRVQ